MAWSLKLLQQSCVPPVCCMVWQCHVKVRLSARVMQIVPKQAVTKRGKAMKKEPQCGGVVFPFELVAELSLNN